MSGQRPESNHNQTEDYSAGLNPHTPDISRKEINVRATSEHEWEDYLLKRELLKGLFEMGWDNPSPI
jgi:ATP-dependent RNA helicase DDX6/DHH1